VGLLELDFHPGTGHRGGSDGGRGCGSQQSGRHRGRSAATDHVGQEEAAGLGVQVDQTVDREAEGGRRVVDVIVLDSTRGVSWLREPDAKLLEISGLTARERQGEGAIRGGRGEGELYLLLRPAFGEGDRQSMFGHVEATGDQVGRILHRHLGEVHAAVRKGGGGGVSTCYRGDDGSEVRKVDLQLHGSRQHIRREGESTTGQGRAGVGETEVDVGCTLRRIRPVSRGGQGLAAQVEHLLLLAGILTERQGLDKVLCARNVIELGTSISVSYAPQDVIAPAQWSSQANAGTASGRVQGDSHDHLIQAFLGIKSHGGTGSCTQRLEALEKSIVSYSCVALKMRVLFPSIVAVETFPWADALLDVQGDLRLHLMLVAAILVFRQTDTKTKTGVYDRKMPHKKSHRSPSDLADPKVSMASVQEAAPMRHSPYGGKAAKHGSASAHIRGDEVRGAIHMAPAPHRGGGGMISAHGAHAASRGQAPPASSLPGSLGIIADPTGGRKERMGIPGIISSTSLGPEQRQRLVSGIIESAMDGHAASGPVHSVQGHDATAYNEGMIHIRGSHFK